MLDVGNGFFMVKFDLEVDRSKVMEGGPWMICYHYLAVAMWIPEFIAPMAKMTRTLAWVRIPGLNFAFYDENFLYSLASIFGIVVKVDTNTVNVERGRFARFCVELDLTKPVKGRISIQVF